MLGMNPTARGETSRGANATGSVFQCQLRMWSALLDVFGPPYLIGFFLRSAQACLQPVEEQRGGEQIAAAARGETSTHDASVHGSRSVASARQTTTGRLPPQRELPTLLHGLVDLLVLTDTSLRPCSARRSRVAWLIQVQPGFQSVQEQRGGQQIAAATWAEAPAYETSVHGNGGFGPLWSAHAASRKERSCGLSRMSEAIRAATVQKVRIVGNGEQGEERLDAGGDDVAQRKAAAEAQCRQPDLEDERKAGCRLRTRASHPEAAQRVRSVAADRYRARKDRMTPALPDDRAEQGSWEHPAHARRQRCAGGQRGTGGRAQQAEGEDGAAMRVDAARRREHRPLCSQADSAQLLHARARGAGYDERSVERFDRRNAAAERAGIHVGVTARIDVADQARLRPRLELVEERRSRGGRDRRRDRLGQAKGRRMLFSSERWHGARPSRSGSSSGADRGNGGASGRIRARVDRRQGSAWDGTRVPRATEPTTPHR